MAGGGTRGGPPAPRTPESFGSALRSAADDALTGQGDDSVHYVKEALKWQYNWIGLAGAAAFAVVSGTALPILLAAGLELMYLSIVPQSSRFRRLVRSWKFAEQKRQIEMSLRSMFLEMPPEVRTRYANVDSLCRAIRENYTRLSSTSQMLMGQMENRLQGLLQGYLRLLYAGCQHRNYLRTTDPQSIKREAAELERSLSNDSPKVQEINRKRVEILTKRLEKYGKISENCQVIDAQCAAMEDVLQLIRDQSVTLRDPQEVSDQLDGLVRDVEQTEQTVREMEQIFDLTAPDMTGAADPLPLDLQPPASTPPNAARNRIRS